jgi:hypothetical protein
LKVEEMKRHAANAKKEDNEREVQGPSGRYTAKSKSAQLAEPPSHEIIWTPGHRALVKFQTSPEQSSRVLSARH